MSSLPPSGGPERIPIMDIVSYDLLVDLTGDPGTFASRAKVRFRGQQGAWLTPTCKRPASGEPN